MHWWPWPRGEGASHLEVGDVACPVPSCGSTITTQCTSRGRKAFRNLRPETTQSYVTQTSPSFSFGRLARQGFYTAANQRLLDLVSLGSGQTVVDLGCGTGAVTRLMLSTVNGLVVVAADPSADLLEEA